MKFKIWSPPYNQFSGGIVALHNLADNLRMLGEEVTIDDKFYAVDGDTLVVYPEIIIGNPIGAKHVMRWILNTPGVIGGDGVYGPDDLIYKFVDGFKAPDESKVLGLITSFKNNFDILKPLGLKRSGRCYLQKKFKGEINEPPDSLRLDDYASKGGLEYLAKVFNEREVFYSYDSATFISVQAALCGIVSIIHPDRNMTAEEYHTKFQAAEYGVAYGIDDLEHAKKTLHFVKPRLEELERIAMDQTRAFLAKAKEKVNSGV